MNLKRANLTMNGRRHAVWMALMIAVCARPVLATDSLSGERVRLAFDDPRPVAKAIELLEARHGWTITYEDPPWAHESETSDVTLEVRQDLDQFEPGKAPKVLVPRGGRLDFRYTVPDNTSNPEAIAEIIRSLLQAHAASGNPGRFRLERTGDVFHVVPTLVKGSDGRPIAVSSVLDVPITLGEGERSGLDILEAICAAISKATGARVEPGMAPMNLLGHFHGALRATDEPARDVLVRFFAAVGRKLSWQLFYDPSLKWYVLNVHAIE